MDIRRYSYRIIPAFVLLLVMTQVPACGGGGGSNNGGGSDAASNDNGDTPDVVDTALAIIGSPQGSALVDVEYTFQPTVIVADGSSLAFTISNKPRWASFNTDTGHLSGIPADVHTGTYPDIIISVSAASHTTYLEAFNITVTASATNRDALLSWVAPTTNSSGTTLALNEIAGYRVYSGTESTNLSLTADTQDGSVTTFTITDLFSGVNYFAVTAYDFLNNESQYSNITSKTFP